MTDPTETNPWPSWPVRPEPLIQAAIRKSRRLTLKFREGGGNGWETKAVAVRLVGVPLAEVLRRIRAAAAAEAVRDEQVKFEVIDLDRHPYGRAWESHAWGDFPAWEVEFDTRPEPEPPPEPEGTIRGRCLEDGAIVEIRSNGTWNKVYATDPDQILHEHTTMKKALEEIRDTMIVSSTQDYEPDALDLFEEIEGVAKAALPATPDPDQTDEI